MPRNQVGSPRNNSKIICGIQSLMIGVTTWLGRKSSSAALQNSTLVLSSPPDGSPDYVTSVSPSQPVPLTPGFIHYIKSNRKFKRKHVWTTPPCRPERYINRESCISTAIQTEAKALLVDTAVSTWAVYQPRSVKRNHLWRSCISQARYSCISTATNKTKAKALLNDKAVSIRAVYQPRKRYYQQQSKLKRKHFWSTQPCRPGRCINRDQQSKVSVAQVYNTTAV